MNSKYLDVLGSGCYADVYKVYVNSIQKEVALKIIDEKKTSSHYQKFFLNNEIRFLKQISKKKHKNIIKTYEVLSFCGKVMIVMELAPNGSTADLLIKYGTLNEKTAHQMFVQILDGVEWLHSLMIGHRDLKLENILLSAKNNPKISDFSFTIIVDPKNPLSDQYCGTFPYMAPEILEQSKYNPLCSDIWALGVCFFILLNDGLPFGVKDEVAMVDNQKNKAFKHRTNVQLSPQLKQLIADMLEPNVKFRPDAKKLKNYSWFKRTANN